MRMAKQSEQLAPFKDELDALNEWCSDSKRHFADINRLQHDLGQRGFTGGILLSRESQQAIKFLIGHFLRNRRLSDTADRAALLELAEIERGQ